MLQKGFLKPQENKKSAHWLNNSLMWFSLGVFSILAGFLKMLVGLYKGEQISYMYLIGIIVGFLFVSIGLWTRFVEQNRKRQNHNH